MPDLWVLIGNREGKSAININKSGKFCPGRTWADCFAVRLAGGLEISHVRQVVGSSEHSGKIGENPNMNDTV